MNIRKSCSPALAIAMLFSFVIPSWGIAEITDVTQPVTVVANEANPSASVEVNSVTVNNSNAATQVSANGENTSAELTVTENVSDSDTTGGGAKAVEVEAENGGTATVDVGGNLSVSDSGSDNFSPIGVKVDTNGDSSTANVAIGGDITVSDESTGAAGAAGIYTNSGGTDTSTEISVGGDITSTAEATGDHGHTETYGVRTNNSDTGSSTKVFVEGDIKAASESDNDTNTTGIKGDNHGKKTSVEIAVGGDVNANSASENVALANGIIADSDSSQSASAIISLEGNVNVSSNAQKSVYATGIYSNTSGDSSKSEITVGGSVTVSGTAFEPSKERGSTVSGVRAESRYGSGNSSEISIGKDVIVSGEATGADGRLTEFGVNADTYNGNTIDVSVGGYVNVSMSSGYRDSVATGLNAISNGEEAKTTIEVAGSVVVQSDKGAAGVYASAKNSGSVAVNIENGVSVNTEGNNSHSAIKTITDGEKSQVDITVTGDVTLEGTAERTERSDGENSSFVPVNAAVSVNPGNGGIINISIADGNAVSQIENNVTVQENGETVDRYSETTGSGIYIMEDDREELTKGSEITIHVEDKNGNDESVGELFENGNIVGGDVGLKVILNENSETNVNVVASGTVTGESAAVLVNKNVTEDNLSLTVWQIVPTEIDNEKHVVAAAERGEEPQVTEKTKKIEENIRYIIKVEPNANATLTTGGTTEYDGYNVAYQGDRVTLKVNAADGYFIEGAYNGLGERIPLQYADGVYYIDVPMGGGIYLSARIGKHEDPAPEGNASAPAVHVAPKGEGLTEIAKMDSVSAKIPAVNKYLKSEEREKMEKLPPIQQLLVVLMKAGFGDAAAASGYTVTEEAKTLADSLNADLRGAVLMQYRWENGVRAKWYVIEMVLEGNQNVRVAFRQLEDGTWEMKMI